MTSLARTSLAALALCLSAAAALAQDTRTIEGSATYLPRIALTENALLMVEVSDQAGTIVGEARERAAGRQVPLPFSVEVPAGQPLRLRAAIFEGGQARWLARDTAIGPGTDAVSVGELVMSPYTPLGFGVAVRCGEEEILAGFDGTDAVIEVRGERARLAPQDSETGRLFVDADDPGTSLFTEGETAEVSWRGEALDECVLAVPPAPGRIRGGGNEPAWSIDIGTEQITLNTAGGAERVVVDTPEPSFSGTDIVLRDSAAGLEVRIVREVCRDTMTGMPHPFGLVVTYDGERLEGCGGAPVDLLTGGTWQVEDIGGAGIIDFSRATLLFTSEGRVSGRATCNEYNGSYTLTGEGLSFGQMATTLRICDEAQMNQEAAFLAALAAVTRFDVDRTGALLLIGAGGETLILARK